MATSTYTTPAFSPVKGQQVGPSVFRISFNAPPLAVSAVGANDALNPANYAFSGAATLQIQSITPTVGDSNSVDLTFTTPVVVGDYRIDVYNIQAA
jgi:hypothetical protein